MKYLIIIACLLASTSSRAQFPKPGMTISETAHLLDGKYTFADTTQYDEKDAEGHWVINKIIYAPYILEGITGCLDVRFSRKGKIRYAVWKRSSSVLTTEELGWHSYKDPFIAVLDSLKDDGTLAQLSKLRDAMPKEWGASHKAENDNSVSYIWNKAGYSRAVMLKEGELFAGWTTE